MQPHPGSESRRNDVPEQISTYRLQKDELERYLNDIFPALGVQVREVRQPR